MSNADSMPHGDFHDIQQSSSKGVRSSPRVFIFGYHANISFPAFVPGDTIDAIN